jgi:hypothetical protein
LVGTLLNLNAKLEVAFADALAVGYLNAFKIHTYVAH